MISLISMMTQWTTMDDDTQATACWGVKKDDTGKLIPFVRLIIVNSPPITFTANVALAENMPPEKIKDTVNFMVATLAIALSDFEQAVDVNDLEGGIH